MSRAAAKQYKKYPVCKELATASKAWKTRSNIVSPGLCDDVIQRLAPSLAQHVGCTLIDINPGIGLWSSKLHEFLKPRKHILMEEKQETFLPYLQPLLDAPGSRYVLRDWHGPDQWHPRRYIDDGLLPPPESVKERKISPILIVANLVSQGTKAGPLSEAITKAYNSHIKVLDAVRSVRMKSDFQAYGPTRMLMWMNDAEKKPLMPKTVAHRGKLAESLESTFDVEEIAGAPHTTEKAQREDSIKVESRKIVAQRMRDHNIVIPVERQQEVQSANASPTSRDWHAEYNDLKEKFVNRKLPQFVGKEPGSLVEAKPGKKSNNHTPEYKRFLMLQSTLTHQNRGYEQLQLLLEKQEEIDKLDLEAHHSKHDPGKQQQIFDQMDARTAALREEAQAMNDKQLERLRFLDDDRRAFSQHPPLLSWDRRRAEPLIVQPDEFYPAKELALLDLQPLPEEKRYPLTPEESICFDHIASHLFGKKGATTVKFLDTLAPGAYAALVPKAPALTDPTRGGRRDVEGVRVRNLTVEMLWQLAKAWDKWLFKPSVGEMVAQHSGKSDTLTLRRNTGSRT